jgi:signal transduction histidine kinase
MARYTIFLLLLAASHCLCLAQNTKQKADSLVTLLKNSTDDIKSLDLLNKISILYLKNKPDSAFKYAYWNLALAEKSKSKAELAKSYALLGGVHRFVSNFDSSLIYQTKALETYEILKDSSNIGRTLIGVGLLHNSQGNFAQAFKSYLTAQNIAEQRNDSLALGKLKVNIGLNFYHEKEYDKALKYYHEGLSIQQRLKDFNSIGNINLNIALIHQKREELEKAVKHFKIAFDIYKQLENKLGMGLCYTNLGNVYTLKKEYLKSIECQYKAINLYNELNDKGGVARVFVNLAETYIHIVEVGESKNLPDSLKQTNKLLDKATSLLEKSIEIRLETGEKNSLHTAYASLANAEKLRGNYKSAYENLEKRTQVKDSVFNIASKEMIANLEANEVIEDKEKVIKVQEVKLEETEKKSLYILIALLSVILVGIILFFRYQINQSRKIEKMRNRIASDLHDEIGSTLSSISISSTIIQNKLDNSVPGVDSMLHQISENTDNMMEAMSDIVWSINTKNDKFENVINRMRAFAIEILEPLNCNVIFTIDDKLLDIKLDAIQRKNIYLIFKEVINNAAKYAACKHVWVEIHKNKNNKLIFKIRDDGKGFDNAFSFPIAKEYNFGGNGLNNIYKRALELNAKMSLNSSIGAGTEIALEFST